MTFASGLITGCVICSSIEPTVPDCDPGVGGLATPYPSLKSNGVPQMITRSAPLSAAFRDRLKKCSLFGSTRPRAMPLTNVGILNVSRKRASVASGAFDHRICEPTIAIGRSAARNSSAASANDTGSGAMRAEVR